MSKIHWSEVSVWHYGGANRRETEMSETDRVRALREYRDTGGIWLGSLVDPALYSGPDADEQICNAGPDADEIDWTGL